MQDKLLSVVEDSLDVMQNKMVHNIKDFISLDVSFCVLYSYIQYSVALFSSYFGKLCRLLKRLSLNMSKQLNRSTRWLRRNSAN